jgi:hypothetical protein
VAAAEADGGAAVAERDRCVAEPGGGAAVAEADGGAAEMEVDMVPASLEPAGPSPPPLPCPDEAADGAAARSPTCCAAAAHGAGLGGGGPVAGQASLELSPWRCAHGEERAAEEACTRSVTGAANAESVGQPCMGGDPGKGPGQCAADGAGGAAGGSGRPLDGASQLDISGATQLQHKAPRRTLRQPAQGGVPCAAGAARILLPAGGLRRSSPAARPLARRRDCMGGAAPAANALAAEPQALLAALQRLSGVWGAGVGRMSPVHRAAAGMLLADLQRALAAAGLPT